VGVGLERAVGVLGADEAAAAVVGVVEGAAVREVDADEAASEVVGVELAAAVWVGERGEVVRMIERCGAAERVGAAGQAGL
jgi:hypothetical protein